MRNLIRLFLISVVVASACKGSRNIPAGAPPHIREKELLEKIYEAENEFTTLSLRASAQFQNDKQNQSFRLQVRMLKDSLIWLDVADPIIGIKIARAVIYKDSIAFVDNWNKKYYTGNIAALQKKINLDLGFEDLQQLFAGNLILKITDRYKMYYRPGHYLLANHVIDETDSVAPAPAIPVWNNVLIAPPYFKASEQNSREPAMGRRYQLRYDNIRPVNDLLYPETIRVLFFQNTGSSLTLEVRDVEKDKALNYPFLIPSEYDRM